jgi:hypothetical protein
MVKISSVILNIKIFMPAMPLPMENGSFTMLEGSYTATTLIPGKALI